MIICNLKYMKDSVMWIQCRCGHQIKYTTDSVSYKARYISDKINFIDGVDWEISYIRKKLRNTQINLK